MCCMAKVPAALPSRQPILKHQTPAIGGKIQFDQTYSRFGTRGFGFSGIRSQCVTNFVTLKFRESRKF